MNFKGIAVFLVGIALAVVMFNLHQWIGYRFDKDIQTARVMETIQALTDESAMDDKSAGAAGNQEAAEYIAAQFEKLGLDKPEGSPNFLQGVSAGQSNVIGILPGSKGKNAESLVIMAHFDSKSGSTPEEALTGATGIATMLETATVMTQGKGGKIKPKKTLIFVAVNGHYQKNAGAAYFAAHSLYPIEKMKVVYLDDLGRNNDKPLSLSIVQDDRYGMLILDRFAVCAADVDIAVEKGTIAQGAVPILAENKIVAAQLSSDPTGSSVNALPDLSEKRFKDALRAVLRYIDQTALR